MYKKRAKFNLNACDSKLSAICNELLNYNEDAVFAISKNYIQKSDSKNMFYEMNTNPIIISSVPLEEIKLPSYYVLRNNELTLWTDNDVIARIIYSNLVFTDGEIKNKKINNLYLDIENEDYIKSLKGM